MRFEGKVISLAREWFMKKQKKCVKKYLIEPLGWILCTIKRELNLSDLTRNPSLEELHYHHNMALAYWR
jgi:hypothetical protein